MEKLVSIIIPNFNGEKYLNDTISSVINQTYKNWELIIVDDYSQDNSVEFVKTFCKNDTRIKLVPLEKNYGRPACPRNIGLTNAKGDFVAFLDSDDLWHPQKLEIQINFMQRNSIEFTCTDFYKFKDPAELDKFNHKIVNNSISYRKITHTMLLFKDFIPTSSVVASRRLFEGINFIEDPRYRAIEDYHCWLMLHQKRIKYSYRLKEILMFYRLAEGSISRSKLSMAKKNWMLFSEYRVQNKKLNLFTRFLLFISYTLISTLHRIPKIAKKF